MPYLVLIKRLGITLSLGQLLRGYRNFSKAIQNQRLSTRIDELGVFVLLFNIYYDQ